MVSAQPAVKRIGPPKPTRTDSLTSRSKRHNEEDRNDHGAKGYINYPSHNYCNIGPTLGDVVIASTDHLPPPPIEDQPISMPGVGVQVRHCCNHMLYLF